MDNVQSASHYPKIQPHSVVFYHIKGVSLNNVKLQPCFTKKIQSNRVYNCYV